ncbi:DUF4287 domain-containing protein [Pedobacter sp. CCM 8938]|uniref:DUF4287 domain-containing protein n=1 Tax=Pedobacter fastidiosus TaxID=2765361 RepID=A0ABR7KZ77_9SPHI|nr:DUF4287 domain-containing protein [Pedobacter fastidiosus]MBC6113018.1 DUF4287 domain-containing protein [Pedobacter fastidiosus]
MLFRDHQKKTGKTPEDFKDLAIAKGLFENDVLKSTVKAAEVIAWLKQDFDLGHGHSLALYHFIKGDL